MNLMFIDQNMNSTFSQKIQFNFLWYFSWVILNNSQREGGGGGRQTPWNLFPSWFPNAVHVILYIINVLCLEWIESKLFTLFLRKVNMSTKLKKTIKEKIQDIKDQRDVIVAFLDEFVAEVCDWILCMMVVKRNHILEPTGPKGVYWLFTFVSVDL